MATEVLDLAADEDVDMVLRSPAEELLDDEDSDPSVELDDVEDDAPRVKRLISGPPEKDETEQELERLVFGDAAGLRNGFQDFDLLNEVEADDLDGEQLADADLFFVDDGTEQVDLALSTVPETTAQDAWQDSDDERITVSLASVPRLRKLRRFEEEDIIDGVEYSRRLRQQFELLNPRPAWAIDAMRTKRRRLSEYDSNSDTDMEYMDLPTAPPLASLLQNAASLTRATSTLRGKKRKIRPETIAIQRTRDIAGTQPSAITSLSFHPDHPLLLSSGPSSTLYLHHIVASPPAPEANPLLISLHIKHTPLARTAFCVGDSRILLSARRKYFHVWNLDTGRIEKVSQVAGQHDQSTCESFKLSPDGRYMALQGSSKKGGGVINVLLTSTLQWAAQVRIESRHGVADYAWWCNSSGIAILGKNGEVTEWSVGSQGVVARWQDEGAVGASVLALGGQHNLTNAPIGHDRWIAVGSSTGIVNIYDRREMLAQQGTADQPIPARPKPHKTLDHLVTPISNLVFSPDGQLLAMSSKWKKDALRLVHLPSATVYKNWPTSSTPLGRITAVAFADGEIVDNNVLTLLAVANEQGKIRLWEIS